MSLTSEPRQARIAHGATEIPVDLPAGGLTISQLIERFGTTLNAPNGSGSAPRTVLRNGEPASEDDLVRPGDSIEVMREASEKG